MKIKILTVICLLSQLASASSPEPVPLSSDAGAACGSAFKPKFKVPNDAPHKEMTASQLLAMKHETKRLTEIAREAKYRFRSQKLESDTQSLKDDLTRVKQDLQKAQQDLEKAKSVSSWKPAQAFCVGMAAGVFLLLGHRAATDPEFGRAAKVPLRSLFSKR